LSSSKAGPRFKTTYGYKYIPYFWTVWCTNEKICGATSLERWNGLDLASCCIFNIYVCFELINLYGSPWRPCALRSFSNLFGLNHKEFSFWKTHIGIIAIMTVRIQKVADESASILVFLMALEIWWIRYFRFWATIYCY